MVTAGLIHYILNLLHVTVHIRDVCVFLAPVFSGLTAISTFLLTRELWNQGAGLLAACFIAIVPGYISRSVAGSFDNEGIAIFALQFTYYLWVSQIINLCLLELSNLIIQLYNLCAIFQGHFIAIYHVTVNHEICLRSLRSLIKLIDCSQNHLNLFMNLNYGSPFIWGLILSMNHIVQVTKLV